MKVLLLFLSVMTAGSLLTTEPPTKQLTCEDFREGTFRMTDGPPNYKIVRTKKKQVETLKDTDGNILFEKTLKVKWLDECSYLLLPEKKKDAAPGGSPLDTLLVEILNLSAHSAVVRVSPLSEPSLSMNSEMIIVQE